MLVDENGILDLRVYSDYPVGVKCNQDILLKCNNLVLPCDPIEEHCNLWKASGYDTEWMVAIDPDRKRSQCIPLYRWSLKLNRCFTLSDLSSLRVKSTANKHNSIPQVSSRLTVTQESLQRILLTHTYQWTIRWHVLLGPRRSSSCRQTPYGLQHWLLRPVLRHGNRWGVHPLMQVYRSRWSLRLLR